MDEIKYATKKLTKSSLDPSGLHINKDKKTVVAAPVSTAVAMPDEESTKAARRRKVAEMQQRGGRASTILSADTDLLGG